MVGGEKDSALFREVSIFKGCPYRGVPMHYFLTAENVTSSHDIVSD